MRFSPFRRNERKEFAFAYAPVKAIVIATIGLFYFPKSENKEEKQMTDLDKLRQEIETAKKEKLQYEHQLTRAKNRLTHYERRQTSAII